MKLPLMEKPEDMRKRIHDAQSGTLNIKTALSTFPQLFKCEVKKREND